MLKINKDTQDLFDIYKEGDKELHKKESRFLVWYSEELRMKSEKLS